MISSYVLEPNVEQEVLSLSQGRYIVKKLLGKGGMAAVFHVEDTLLHIPRAIKVLHPDLLVHESLRKCFDTEARSMARIFHPP